MKKVWEKRALLGPRNISLWREPWGFYLRTKWWRLTAGPLFGWKVQRCWRLPRSLPRRPIQHTYITGSASPRRSKREQRLIARAGRERREAYFEEKRSENLP